MQRAASLKRNTATSSEKMNDRYIAGLTVPEIVELIKKLLDELELRFMEETNGEQSNRRIIQPEER